MSDPRRLLGGEASDFEKELLRSWEAEQPSDAARAGVLAAVGLGAGAAAATAVKLGAAAGGSIAPKAAAVSALVVAKWAAVAVVAAAVGASLGYVQHAAHVQAQREASAVTPRVASVPTTPTTPATPPTIATTIATASAPPATATDAPAEVSSTHTLDVPRARSVDPRAKSAPRERPSALGEQVSALDSARRALAAGDAPSAIRQLDDYEARFRDGALVEEAEVLRVEALLAEGDHASASRVGDRFLAAHPSSPHAARVRALLASP